MTPAMRPLKKLRSLLPLLAAACVLGMAGSESGLVAPVFHASFKSASDAAAADQSLVLLIFGAEWCGPCKLLKSQTLTAPDFLAQDAPLHVAEVDIDAEKDMARDFAVEAVPTLILATPEGKIVSRETGFMEAGALLAWLKTGRAQAAAGQWEGTVPGAQFNEFIRKSAAADLGTNEIRQLVDWLADPSPANRAEAGKLLLEQRERAVPPLIEAAGDP
jgi:thiol-disulfide isomerase/thioredoxin